MAEGVVLGVGVVLFSFVAAGAATVAVGGEAGVMGTIPFSVNIITDPEGRGEVFFRVDFPLAAISAMSSLLLFVEVVAVGDRLGLFVLFGILIFILLSLTVQPREFLEAR